MAFPTGSTMSGTKSDTRGSTYQYSTGMQPNGTPSIGNWNTGGSVVGMGDKNGVYAPDGSRIGGQMTDPRLTGGPNIYQSLLGMADRNNEVTSGPIGPALGPQGLPNIQIPMGYPPAPRPAYGAMSMPPGYAGHANHPTWGAPASPANPWTAAYGGYRRTGQFGPGPQGTSNWRNTTTVYKTPGATQYTGNPGASYSNMGSDFRSTDFNPSSYPR